MKHSLSLYKNFVNKYQKLKSPFNPIITITQLTTTHNINTSAMIERMFTTMFFILFIISVRYLSAAVVIFKIIHLALPPQISVGNRFRFPLSKHLDNSFHSSQPKNQILTSGCSSLFSSDCLCFLYALYFCRYL